MILSTQEGDSGFGFGSGISTEPIDQHMQEFISSEITHGILEWTLVIFVSVKKRILELLDGRIRAFQAKIIAG